jgi:hypothetical protein
MDLAGIVDDEFVQPLRGAIVTEDMVATRQLIDSVQLRDTSTKDKDEVSVYAESYILELRDGEQYKSPPTLADITTWIDAKGLTGTLDPYAVLATIRTEGTTWDKKGGSTRLKDVINPQNVQRIMNIAVENSITDLRQTKWLSR